MSRTLRDYFPASKSLLVCLAGLAFIIAYLPVHGFISTWGGTTVGPLLAWKSWKEMLLVVLLGIFLVWLAKRGKLKAFFADHFVTVIGLYGFLTVMTGLFAVDENGLQATMAGLAMNLRYPLIALLAYGIFRFSNIPYFVWRRWAGKFLVGAGVFLALLGILQVTVIPQDFLSQFGYVKNETIAPYILIDENPNAKRAFATLRGPNDYGAFLILPLLIALTFYRRSPWLIATVAVIAAGIFVSGSRSAWLGALIAVFTWVVLKVGRKVLVSKKAIIGIASGLGAGLLLFYASLSIPAVRLAVFHSSPSDSSLTEGSTDQHWLATSNGIERVITQPQGCGVGCAGPASYYSDQAKISENYYVQLAEEVGVGGLLLWLALIAIIARRLYTLRNDWLARVVLASGIGFSAIGFWLHVWSDDPLSLTWWALAGMVLAAVARPHASQKAKNSVS